MNPHDYPVPGLKSPLLIQFPRLSDSLVYRRSSPFRQETQRVREVKSGFELLVYESLLSLDLSGWTQWCFEVLVLAVPELILLTGDERSCR